MKKFTNEAEAITAIEKLEKNYNRAPYLEKASILDQIAEVQRSIPTGYKEALRLAKRYTETTPTTAMQRAQNLVHRIETSPTFVFPLRQEARGMLDRIPKTREYESVRDLLRHYATLGD